jgi:single-strand DNA-binding protein
MTTASLAINAARAGEDATTEWFSIIAFGRAGDELARHQKGDLVSVAGQMCRTSFIARDGEQRTGWSLTVESILSARTVRPSGRLRQSPSTTTRSHAQAALCGDGVADLYRP